MARGGKRPGAGRRTGNKNKSTIEREMFSREVATEALAAGVSPLDYMLHVMRTSTDTKRRDAMAIAAAPYVHPRLANVEHAGNQNKPVTYNIITGVPRSAEDVE